MIPRDRFLLNSSLVKKNKKDAQPKKAEDNKKKQELAVAGGVKQLSEDELEDVVGGLINGDPEEEDPLIP